VGRRRGSGFGRPDFTWEHAVPAGTTIFQNGLADRIGGRNPPWEDSEDCYGWDDSIRNAPMRILAWTVGSPLRMESARNGRQRTARSERGMGDPYAGVPEMRFHRTRYNAPFSFLDFV